MLRHSERTLEILEFLLHNCGSLLHDIAAGVGMEERNAKSRLDYLRRHGWVVAVGSRNYITMQGIFLLLAYKRVELGDYLKKLEEAKTELERIIGYYKSVEKFVQESVIGMKKAEEENKKRVGKMIKEILDFEVGVMTRKRV